MPLNDQIIMLLAPVAPLAHTEPQETGARGARHHNGLFPAGQLLDGRQALLMG